MEAGEEERAAGRFGEAARVRAVREGFGPLGGRSLAEQMDRAMGRVEETGLARKAAGEPGAAAGDQARADAAHLTALGRAWDIRQQIFGVVQSTQKTAIQGIEDQIKMQKSLVQQLREQRQTAKERFGALDVTTQERVIRAAEKSRAGDELTRGEAGLLSQYGPTEALRTSARAAYSRLAERRGAYGRVVGPAGARGPEDAAQRDLASSQRMQQQLQATIKQDMEVTVKLERDDEGIIRKIVAITTDEIQERNRKLGEAVRLQLLRMQTQLDGMDTAGQTRRLTQGAGTPVGG
jgi:hypothetical protein